MPDGRGAVLEFECVLALTPSTGIIGVTINSCYAISDGGDRVDGLNNGVPGSATATAGFSTSTEDETIWQGCVGGEVLTVGGERLVPERCATINLSGGDGGGTPDLISDLSLAIDGPEEIFIGESAEYTLTIQSRAVSAEAVEFVDVFPAGGRVEASPSQGTCQVIPRPGLVGGTVVRCALGSMPIGGTATVVMTATPDHEGPYVQGAIVAEAGRLDWYGTDNHGEFVTIVKPLGPQAGEPPPD